MSNEQVLRYAAKYASKAESRSEPFQEVLTALCSSGANSEQSAKKVIHHAMNKSPIEHDYLAQEVHHILEGVPLYHCSRPFLNVTVKTSKCETSQIRGERKSTRGKLILEKYAERASIDETSLYDMAQNYSFFRGDWVRKESRAKKPTMRVFPQLTLCGTNE